MNRRPARARTCAPGSADTAFLCGLAAYLRNPAADPAWLAIMRPGIGHTTSDMTPSLARALGPSGINVNSIGPGFTATEASLSQGGNEKVFEHALAGQCLKRREEPTDLVGAAVFLASEDSDFITGQFIVVDGGNVML